MTKRVCAQSPDTRRLCRFLIPTPHLIVRPRQFPELNRRSEDPILRQSKLRGLFPPFQSGQVLGIHVQGALRLWSFYLIDDLTDDSSLYRQLGIEPVNITAFSASASLIVGQNTCRAEPTCGTDLPGVEQTQELVHFKASRFLSCVYSQP